MQHKWGEHSPQLLHSKCGNQIEWLSPNVRSTKKTSLWWHERQLVAKGRRWNLKDDEVRKMKTIIIVIACDKAVSFRRIRKNFTMYDNETVSQRMNRGSSYDKVWQKAFWEEWQRILGWRCQKLSWQPIYISKNAGRDQIAKCLKNHDWDDQILIRKIFLIL